MPWSYCYGSQLWPLPPMSLRGVYYALTGGNHLMQFRQSYWKKLVWGAIKCFVLPWLYFITYILHNGSIRQTDTQYRLSVVCSTRRKAVSLRLVARKMGNTHDQPKSSCLLKSKHTWNYILKSNLLFQKLYLSICNAQCECFPQNHMPFSKHFI